MSKPKIDIAPQVNEDSNYSEDKKTQPKKVIKALNRQVVFPAKCLESEEDIDSYVEKMRTQLKQLMQNCDGIQLK